jgi:Mg-chelatase subunit ChlI
MSDNKKTDVVAEAKLESFSRQLCVCSTANENYEGEKWDIAVRMGEAADITITALIKEVERLNGKTQFCAQCEAKGKENAALLKRCEDAEAVVGKLVLEIIDLKQALSQKGQSDEEA